MWQHMLEQENLHVKYIMGKFDLIEVSVTLNTKKHNIT